ncbi:hypothetical protein PIB30_087078 [Stylosanthes scabra]|uniref:DRBM domain-containing protein n=1 Tax=Stylosanthes scabra TaxID=79078 RepID=A0ABU6WW41_9FABA|nr:hypothetical protein [Stylosanthes scabra]
METKELTAVAPKKAIVTPKTIIHQKFGTKACYTIEEVKESHQNDCPGLNIPQTRPSLYRCSLQLPELFVVSGIFKKKKDAEQSAAELAIQKMGIVFKRIFLLDCNRDLELGIRTETENPTPQEAWESVVARINYVFSENFLSSLHPLSSHIGATLQRKVDLCGSLPVSVLAVYDAKLCSLCKFVDPEVESNPFLVMSYIIKASTKLSGFLATAEQHPWIIKQSPYPEDVVNSLLKQYALQEPIQIAAVRIPSSEEKSVEAVTLHISPKEYYLDIIANELGLEDASNVLISRNLGKASSETRLFFAAPKSCILDPSSILPNGKNGLCFEGPSNLRASYLSGHDIAGDAILASIGYTWKCRDLIYEDVAVQAYYRMVIGKTPGGIYKISREAMLASELPSRFTTRANWRGSLPRDILCIFCRQHRLSEPVFSITSPPSNESSESYGSNLKAADQGKDVIACVSGAPTTTRSKQSDTEMFQCEVKLLSRSENLIVKCFPKDCFKKQNDAIQNASLKLLVWLNNNFNNTVVPFEPLYETADIFDIQIFSENFFREISDYHSIKNCQQLNQSVSMNSSCTMPLKGVCLLKIEGPDSGVCPCNGSLSCISYSVSLVVESENIKKVIEVRNEFEFEVGVGAVISYVEEVVMQMSVGQSASFTTSIFTSDLIFASASDSVEMQSLLSSELLLL